MDLSELFEITIDEVDGATVRTQIEVIHPDQWGIPDDKNIALQIVLGPYSLMKSGLLIGAQPLSEDEAKKRAMANPAADRLDEWLNVARGRKVSIGKSEYDRLNEDGPGDEPLAFWSMEGESYFKCYRPDLWEFITIAANAIEESHLENEKNNPRPHMGAPHPEATLVFTVADANYVSHLVAGLNW